MTAFSSLQPVELPADAVEVARVLDAWGVKGWFKLAPHSAQPQALFSSKRWYLQPKLGLAPADIDHKQAYLLPVYETKEHAGWVVACSREIGERSAAEALKGARVFVPRSSFPTPEKDEYYWVDLLGLDVINREQQVLGQVVDLLQTGPQTVLVLHQTPDAVVVQNKADAPAKKLEANPAAAGKGLARLTVAGSKGAAQVIERMIPFVSIYIDAVDLSARCIRVDWSFDD